MCKDQYIFREYIEFTMRIRTVSGAIILAVICILLTAGCATLPDQPAPTTEPTAVATTVATPIPTPTPEPELFPDALAPGEKFVYGSNETKIEMTVRGGYIDEYYEYHDKDWGRDGQVDPADGNKFLIIDLIVAHKGTKKEIGAPYPGSVFVFFEGHPYPCRDERAYSDKSLVNTQWTTEDYYGGILHVYERREGLLIYEVPESLTLDKAYVQANLGDETTPVWKLA